MSRSRIASRHLHAYTKDTIKPTSSMPSHFISSPSNDSIAMPETELKMKNCVTRKFVFHNSKITQLKAMASVRGMPNPTPLQVLSALIFKCATAASTHNPTGSFKPSPLFQLRDTRPKMAAPMPKTCIGNLRALSEQIKKRSMEVERGIKEMEENEIESKKNMFILMDTPSGDGIEALVSLEEEHMAKFEVDKQLLQFASLHQNVLGS